MTVWIVVALTFLDCVKATASKSPVRRERLRIPAARDVKIARGSCLCERHGFGHARRASVGPTCLCPAASRLVELTAAAPELGPMGMSSVRLHAHGCPQDGPG